MTHSDRWRVLMIVANNPYPQDPRVRNEARALLEAGHQVTVLAPRRWGQRWSEDLGGVRVVRFPSPFTGDGALAHALDHVAAAMATFALSIVLAVRPGFDVVHVHNPPDTLGLVAAFWQLFGRRFVFDHHDLASQMYLARRGDSRPDAAYRALVALERFCVRRADRVIATNTSYRDFDVTSHGIARERVTIVRNGPDTSRFTVARDGSEPRPRESVVCYAGVIGGQDGVDELVRAMDHIVHVMDRTDIRCVVVGDGDALGSSRALADELGLGTSIEFTGLLTFEDMVQRISECDVCVEPAPSNGYNDRSTMIKVMEYMAAGKPVVAYDLPEHRVSGGDVVQYAARNSVTSLATTIVELVDDVHRRAELGRAGRARAVARLDWSHQAPNVVRTYARLHAGAPR